MTRPSGSGPKPSTLSWVHVVLALAVGAGMPLLWMGFASPDQAVADGSADRLQVDGALSVSAADAAAASVAAVPGASSALAPAAPLPVATRSAGPLIPRVRDPNGDQSPDITDFINNGEVPTMAEVISRLQAAGVSGGLAAFNPPGTRPPLIGIAVSEDFELPPGYVRHHQVTDDGRRIEAILMFSPDHPLVVAAGGGDSRPQDRVVPPALVPPGLPVRHIVVPPAVEPGR